MLPKAYGTFIKKDNLIFRTEAFLQWGQVDKLLGLIIMLNPGKSRLLDKKKWEKFKTENIDHINDRITLDATMKKITYILSESHPNLQGKVKIINLFNLRNPESKDAINNYKSIILSQKYNKYIYSKFDDVGKYPWIWLGWGVKKDSILDTRKHEVKSIAVNNKVHNFALYPDKHKYKESIYIYHPNPRNKSQANIYADKMITQMKKYFNEKG